MRELFKNGIINLIEIGNHTIKLMPNGCFQVRETLTSFQIYESNNTDKYEDVRNYVMKLNGLI